MITLPPYSITYKHFAELCEGQSINVEVSMIIIVVHSDIMIIVLVLDCV